MSTGNQNGSRRILRQARPFRLRSGLQGVLPQWVISLALVFIVNSNALAQKAKPKEYEVKATYLYNFARFVEWPASAALKDDLFSICVLGQDPFGPALDAVLAGETIDGKAVVAKRIARSQEAASCRVLYISPSEDRRLKDILAAVDKMGVLTVSDIPEFSRHGGMIEFVLDGSKIRFEVNLANAEDAGLSLSSELLKVATAVRRNSHSGD